MKIISKCFFCLLLLCAVLPLNLFSQSSKYFKETYGDIYPWVENGHFVKVIDDGYLTGGERFINTDTVGNYIFIKLNKSGNVGYQMYGIDSLRSNLFLDAYIDNLEFVFAGAKQNTYSSKFKHLIIKTDSSGNIIWQRNIGDSLYSNRSYCINKTLDGGYVLGGYRITNVYTEGALIKLDSSGNEVWSRHFPILSGNNVIRSVQQSNDSSYTLLGGWNRTIDGGKIWRLETDKDGFELTTDTFAFTTIFNAEYNDGYHLVKIENNSEIVTGLTGFFGVFSRGIIFKIDSTQQIVWQKILASNPDGSGNIWSSYLRKSVILSDHSIVSAGGITANTPGGEFYRILLLKLDSAGNEIWRRKYTHEQFYDSYGYDMEATEDGGFIIAGRAEGAGIGADMILIKTNCLGFTAKPIADFSISWSGLNATFTNLSARADTCIYYFGDGDSAIVQLTDTIDITHQYTGAGPWQAYMIAYACGEADTIFQTVYTGIDEANDFYSKTFNIHPNPASDYLTVNYKLLPDVKNALITITDLRGRIILEKEINITSSELHLELKNIESGSYHVSIITDGIKKSVKPFIKL